MKKLFWLLPVLLAILVTGCLKDDLSEKTIVLMGTESGVQPIGSVIPDTLLTFIHDAEAMSPASVLELPEGNMPPDIQGEFVFSPRDLYGYNSEHPYPNPEDTLFLRLGGNPSSYTIEVGHLYHTGDTLIQGNDTLVFPADSTIMVSEIAYYYPEGQHNRLVSCELFGDIPETGGDYKLKNTNATVMGHGNDFTLYFTIPYECEYKDESGTTVAEYTLTRGYIITGTISQYGINQAKVACVNKNVDVKGNPTLVPPDAIESMINRIYIYRIIGGGTAVRKHWVKP